MSGSGLKGILGAVCALQAVIADGGGMANGGIALSCVSITIALDHLRAPMSEDFFEIEIKRTKDVYNSYRLHFPNEEKENAEPVESSLDARFAGLSKNWTSTSISFFTVFPMFSDLGYFYAEHDFEKTTLQEIRKVAEGLETDVDDDGTTIDRFKIHLRELDLIGKRFQKTSQLMSAAEMLKRSTLGALVSEYEAFIGELLVILSEHSPNAFLDPNTQFSISELEDYDSIADLKSAMLLSAVEDWTHGNSHLEVLRQIEKRFGVNLTSDRTLIAEFVEICQRRHLIMHAGAKVNKRYLRICKEAGFPENQLPKEGEKISISRDYLRRSTARVFQVGFFTLHLLWQKLLGNWERSDGVVLATSHDFLEADLTKMARRTADFALGRKKQRPHNVCHAYLLINKAQSYLFDPQLSDDVERSEKIRECLKLRDWSMRSTVAELALACLREDYDGIADKVVAAATVGDAKIVYQDIFTWNIFRRARDNPEFMEGVVRAFGEVGVLVKGRDQKLLESPCSDI